MATRALAPALMQIPNALTLARFALIPAFVVLVLQADGGASWAAGAVFGAAAITDQVDGWLARRWHVESEFGKLADPLADRVMIDAAVVLLWLEGRLPWPALAIVLARDLVLVGGSRFAIQRGYAFEVSFLGKAATWVLYASLAAVIVTEESARWPLWLFWAGVALAVAAGVLYVAAVRRTIG